MKPQRRRTRCEAVFSVSVSAWSRWRLSSSLRELAQRVRVREVPEFSAALPHERPTRVTVKWSDGTTTRGEVRNARGNPDNPLDASEVEFKFRRNVESILDERATDALVTSILHGPVAAGHYIAEATDQVIGPFCP